MGRKSHLQNFLDQAGQWMGESVRNCLDCYERASPPLVAPLSRPVILNSIAQRDLNQRKQDVSLFLSALESGCDVIVGVLPLLNDGL